jgi:hypothetical protein
MPDLKELLDEYNRGIQKNTMLTSPEEMGVGFGAAEEQDIPFSSKDLGQSIYEDVENRRSRNQGGWETLGIAGARLAGKTLTKTAASAGFLGGLLGIDNNRKDYKDPNVGWDVNSWITGAADNGLAVAAMDLEKDLEDVTPLYNSLEDKAANKSNFFNNLKDGDFWAGDAVDAGAFLLSAYLTGAGTAGLKIGENVALGLAKKGLIGSASKGMKLAKLAAATNLLTATAVNTASEAMFEGKEVRDAIREQKANEEYGVPFDQLNAEQKLAVNKVAAEGAAKTFALNSMALAIPNLIQMKSLMKTAGKLSTSASGLTSQGLNTTVEGASSKMLKGELFGGLIKSAGIDVGKVPYLGATVKGFNKFGNTLAGSALKSAAIGVASEGLWEENVQLAISDLLKKNPTSSLFDTNTYSDIANNMQDNFSTEEGRKSMFLGAIIGGIANTRGGIIDYNRNAKKQKRTVVESMLSNMNLFQANNMFEVEQYEEMDAEGKPVKKSRFKLDAAGNPIIDQAKVDALAMGKDQLEYLDDIATLAESNGNDVLANLAKGQAIANWVKNHYNTGTEDLIEEKLAFLENLSDKEYLEMGLNPAEKGKLISDLKASTVEFSKLAANIDSSLFTKDSSDAGAKSFIARKQELYNIGTTLSNVRTERNRLTVEKAQLESTPESAALGAKRLAYIDLKLNELAEAESKFAEEFQKLANPVTGEKYFKNEFKKSILEKTNTIVPETTTLEEFKAFENTRLYKENLALKGQNIENEFIEKGIEDRLYGKEPEDAIDVVNDLLQDDIAISDKSRESLQKELDAKEAALIEFAEAAAEFATGEDYTTTNPDIIAKVEELALLDETQEGATDDYILEEQAKIAKAKEDLNNLKIKNSVTITNKSTKEQLLSFITNAVKGNLFNFNSSEEYDNLSELEKQQKALTNMIKVLEETQDKDYADTIAEYKTLLAETIAAIEVVKKRVADKALQQEKIINNAIEINLNQFGLDESGNTINKALYDFYKSILGDELDKILAGLKDLSAWGKIGFLTNHLLTVKKNISKAQIAQLEEIKNTLTTRVLELVDTNKKSGSPRAFIKNNYNKNPVLVFKSILPFLFKNKTSDTDLINDFSKDFIVNNLKQALKTNDFVNLVDLAVIDEILDLHKQVIGIQNTLDFINSTQNIITEVVTENAIAGNKTLITPTNQQLLAIRDLVRFFFTKKPNSGFSGLAYLKGYAGTGKTNVVLKWFSKLSGLKSEEIFATGHNEHSSKAINDSIGTNKQRSVTELKDALKTDLPGIKLIVIDEINALSYQEIEEIVDLLNAYNKKNNKEIKIIALGDPNQLTKSQNSNFSPLDSLSEANKNMTIITPLTIRYRSNVRAVVEAQDIFLGKTKDVVKDGVYLSTNLDRSLGADGSLATNGIEESLKQRDLKDGKTRAIVVHPNDVAAWEAKNLGVEVVSYIDVQGRTIDEVFIDLPRTFFQEDFMYNKAMYTAASRATNFIYFQGVKTTTVIDNVISEDTAKNANAIKEANEKFLKDRQDELAQLDEDYVAPKPAPTPPPVPPVTPTPPANPPGNSTNTPPDPPEPEENDIDNPPNPPEDNNPPGTEPDAPTSHVPSADAFNLDYPKNESFLGKKKTDVILAGEGIIYVPITNSQGNKAIGIYVQRNDKYLEVGVLSQNQLNNPGPKQKEIFKKFKEALDPNNLNAFTTVFVKDSTTGYLTVSSSSDLIVLGRGQIESVSTLKYVYSKIPAQFKQFDMGNLLNKFKKAFNLGKKFDPKNVKIRVFNDNEIKALNTDKILEAGLPYLVIENPVQGSSSTANTQFIALERKSLNVNEHSFLMAPIMAFVEKYNALKDELGVTVEELADIISTRGEGSYLPTLLEKIKTETGKDITLTNSQIELIKDIDLLLHQPLDPTIAVRKKVKNAKDPVMVNGKEITGEVKSIDNGIAKVKFGNETMEVSIDDLKVAGNRRPGKAQVAFNLIAKGNKLANGYPIRIDVKTTRNSFTSGKSLLPKTEKSDPLNQGSMSLEELVSIFTKDQNGNVSDLRVPIIRNSEMDPVLKESGILEGRIFDYTDGYINNSKVDNMLFLDKLEEVTPTSVKISVEEDSIEPPTEEEDKDNSMPPTTTRLMRFLLKTVNRTLGAQKTTTDILKYLQSIDKTLTAEEVKFVTAAELLKISEGTDTWGLFKDGIIYLNKDEFDNAYENVARHELFHRIFNMMLTPAQQELVRQKAVAEFNLDPNIDAIGIEEAIAQRYQEWRSGSKISSFFNILFNRIRKFLGMAVPLVSDMDTFFQNIESGQFTDIVGFDGVTRNYDDIKKDFGNAVNFKNSEVMIIEKLNSIQLFGETLLQVGKDGKTFVEKGYFPKSSNEKFNSIFNEFVKEHAALSAKTELTADEKLDLELLTRLKNKDIYSKLIADMFEETAFSLENVNEEAGEILAGDWSDSSKDAEQTNHEAKLSAKVKQFLSTIIAKRGENYGQVNPRFAYLACLETLSNVDASTKKLLELEIDKRFRESSLKSEDFDAVQTALNKLIANAYNEGVMNRTRIPAVYTFINENTLKNAEGKYLHRGSQSTSKYFKSISEKTGLTLNEIAALYIINDSQNTFTELYAQVASLYKQNVFYGEYSGASDNQTQLFKNAVVEDQLATYNNNIRDIFFTRMKGTIDGLTTAKWLDEKIAALKKEKNKSGSPAAIALTKDIYSRLFNESIQIDSSKFNFISFTSALEKILKIYRKNELKDGKPNEDLESIFTESTTGWINSISKNLIDLENQTRPASYRRSDKKIAYLFSSSSSAINILQYFTDKHKKPEFLNSPNYLRNIFVNGINTIHKYVNFDAVRSSYSDYNVRYSSETEKDWFARNFKYFFLANTIDETGKGRYVQQFLTISNKPNIIAAEINFLKWNAVESSILAILDQQNNRSFTNVKVDNNLNIFEVLSPRGENQTDLDYARQIIAAIKAKGPSLTTTFDLKNNIDLSKLASAVETYAESEEDLASLYFANFYVNSHQLNHLVAGDQAFYKGAFDVIKRMSIAFATGYSGLVSKFGLPPSYRSLVVKDIESVLGEDFTRFQKIWGKKFDLTDAQGYMTPKRAAEVRKGFGNAFKLGSILKPVHFEIDENGVPRAVKYSCIELTDELCDMFPKLKQVRQALENNNIDEMVFESAVKVGKPTNIMKPNADGSIGTLVGDKYIIDEDSVLILQNSNYRIQENPEKSVEGKEVALPNQLNFFADFSGNNTVETARLFNAQTELMNLGSRKLLQKLGIKDRVEDDSRKQTQKEQREKLRAAASEKKSQGLSDRQQQFINDPQLGINTPFLVKKIVIDIASLFTKATVGIKIPGAGLVLQSAYGTAEFTDKDGNLIKRDLKWRDKDGNSEVVLPDMWKGKFKEGDVIMFDTMVGFRIPSTELHSAVPLKVVGFYPGNKNAIIAPKEIVYFHGSDYDVDKLYVMRREEYSSNKSILTIGGKELYKGGTITPTSEEFLNNIQEDFSNTLVAIQAAKKQGDKERVTALRKHLDLLSDLKVSHYKNVVVESFLKIITDKVNEDLMMSPITMERFKGMGIGEESAFDLVARLNGFNEKKPNYDDFKTRGEYEDAVKTWLANRDKVIFPNRDLYNLEDQMLMHKDNFSSTSLTGIFASMAKAVAYYFQSTVNPYTKNIAELNDIIEKIKTSTDETVILNRKEYTKEKAITLVERKIAKEVILEEKYAFSSKEKAKYPELKETYHIEINGIEYKGLNYFENTKEVIVAYNKNGQPVYSKPSITETIDALINAAIDSVKEQILPIIGVSNSTGGATVALVAMGVPLKDIVMLMQQPVVKIISSENFYKNGKINARKAIYERLEELKQMSVNEFEAAVDENKSPDITKSHNKKISEMTVPELINQAAIITHYMNKVNSVGEDISKGSSAYKILKSFPVDFPEMQDTLEDFDDLKSNDFVFTNVDVTILPHINKAFKLLQTLKSNMENLLFVNNKVLQEFSKRLMETEVAQEGDKVVMAQDFLKGKSTNNSLYNIREAVIHYLMTGLSFTTPEGLVINNSTLAEEEHVDKEGKKRYGVDAFNIRFEQEVKELKRANPENIFLKNISFNKYRKLVFNAARNANQADLLNFQMQFESLKNNAGFTKLQYDFVKYAIVNQGMSFGITNFSLLLPSEIYRPMMKEFNTYFEELTGNPVKFKEILDNIAANFKLQYALNTGETTVQALKKDAVYTEENGVITLTNESENLGSLFIKTGFKNNSKLYVLLSNPLEKQLTYTLVGKIKNFPSYQYDSNLLRGTYSIQKAFNLDVPVVKTSDIQANNFQSRKVFVPGQKVRLVNYSDDTRLKLVEVTVGTASATPNAKGLYEYTVESSTFVNSIMSDAEIMNSEAYQNLIKSGVIHEEAMHKIKNDC